LIVSAIHVPVWWHVGFLGQIGFHWTSPQPWSA
jgi:hypothetical protein